MLKQNKYFIFDNQNGSGLKQKVRRIVCDIISIVYHVWLSISKPTIQNKQYNVSVCAIFKNEAPYLHEWIEFNHLVGIDHFYLYNNNSTDNYYSILAPYIDSGLVTLIDWPNNQQQMEAYKDGIKRFSSQTKWIGFIDIDEFIVPKSTDNIYDFLKAFEKNRGAVKIYWKLFGSSGHIDRDTKGLVVEDFTTCWPKYCDVGKCFYNTAFDFDGNSSRNIGLHHSLWTNWKGVDIPPVNIFDYICIGNINRVKSLDFPIQINHYFTKSYNEYAMKCAKGDVYFEINPHDEAYFFEHEMKCTSIDFSAYKYLIKLKLIMGKE